jgi:predicted acyltransferase
MKSKAVMIASAVLLCALGLTMSFLPQETAASLGLGTQSMAVLLLQVLAAAFMGMGYLNWLSKGNPMGGIYSRPLALANLLLFGAGGIALDRASLHGSVPQGIKLAAVAFTVLALGFGWLMFFHDPIAKAAKGPSRP